MNIDILNQGLAGITLILLVCLTIYNYVRGNRYVRGDLPVSIATSIFQIMFSYGVVSLFGYLIFIAVGG